MCKSKKVTKSAEKSSARKTENGNVVKKVAKLATPVKKLSTGSRNEKPLVLQRKVPSRPEDAENIAEILEFPDPLEVRRAQKNNYSTDVGRKGYDISKIAFGRSRGKWLTELFANEQIDASSRWLTGQRIYSKISTCLKNAFILFIFILFFVSNIGRYSEM